MEISVFSMKGCPHCDNLKNTLKENNIEFEQWGDFWNWESEVIDTSYGYTFEIIDSNILIKYLGFSPIGNNSSIEIKLNVDFSISCS